MADTRRQQELRKATIKKVEASLLPQIQGLTTILADQRAEIAVEIADQKETIAEKNARLDKNLADMFAAMRLQMASLTERHLGSTQNHSDSANLPPPNDFGRVGRVNLSNGYSDITRLEKLDFPRFNGDKTKEWLFKIEQFFAIDHTSEELKVSLASIHYDAQTATWHQSIVQSPARAAATSDWQAYRALLKERFEELLDDPTADLNTLQETKGIVDYHDKFELIRTRVTLPEDYLMSAYLAGLRTDTQMHLRIL